MATPVLRPLPESDAALLLLDTRSYQSQSGLIADARRALDSVRRISQMVVAKFAVGDRVDQSPRDRFVGTVKAIYMTRESEIQYIVDMEGHGTLRLCSEHDIVAHNH
jgi:hypothetical protein